MEINLKNIVENFFIINQNDLVWQTEFFLATTTTGPPRVEERVTMILFEVDNKTVSKFYLLSPYLSILKQYHRTDYSS